MAGAIAGTAILNALNCTDKLHTITLSVNNSCNLTCPHCYLQDNKNDQIISDEVMEKVYSSSFQHLAIVGKEPLANALSINKCEEIATNLVRMGRTVSLITNGHGLKNITNKLLDNLSYIDISFDGGPETYNDYRNGNIENILTGISEIYSLGYKNVNALHVLNDRTIANINDMMKVSDIVKFKKIIFSPYIITHNYGANSVKVVDLLEIVRRLSASKAFLDESNAYLLLDIFNFAGGNESIESFFAAAKKIGVTDKIIIIKDDPLLHGIVRITYDGYILTPQQSLNTRKYNECKFNMLERSIEDIYCSMLNGNMLENNVYAY